LINPHNYRLAALSSTAVNLVAHPPLRACLRLRWSAALHVARIAVALIACLFAAVAHADEELIKAARQLEANLSGFPQRTVAELVTLLPRAELATPDERRYVSSIYGQALVAAGNIADAAALAGALSEAANQRRDSQDEAAALLIRSAIESSTGDTAKSMILAREARDLATDVYLRYWATLTLGTSARARGLPEEGMTNLQEALSIAEATNNAYRRSSVLYQLSVLQLTVKNLPAALDASLASFEFGKAAQSPYAMANARMAESAVMEVLERPARELAAMEEALAIARIAGSQVSEARALANLADIRIERKQYQDAFNLARRSLDLARSLGDSQLAATNMANMGFALMGLGRIADGKQLTDRALAEYDRAGAHAETADLIGEYARHLEQVGDYHGALALFHRERKLRDEIAVQTRQRALLEVQEKFESEKRRREIDFLNRENELKSLEIANRVLSQRVLWLVAGLLAVSFAVVAWLYRKLRLTNRLLAQGNAELSVQSSHDPLTGLFNRRHFQNHIAAQEAYADHRRREDDATTHALLLIDIDHFKETNDRFGHAVGDSVLVAVASRLRAALRDTDMIVRWGGEEFLVYATTRADSIDDIAARILNAVSAQAITVDEHLIRTTVSIGYMGMPLPNATVAVSWDKAIRLVDMALYIAKSRGRNRAYGIRKLVRDDEDALAAAERDLENAWNQGLVELTVLYGPFPASGVGGGLAAGSSESAQPPYDSYPSVAAR